jgi:peroxiredoxin
MLRESASDKFPVGSALPEFELPNVDGKKLGATYLKSGKAMLVAFTCNHCPYVKGSEEMLISIVKKFEGQGLKTVAISSNDATQYPEDSFENMKTKSKSMGLPYPYLYDETQLVAKQFDAACTPEFYLFDANQTLVYHGAINDSPRDPAKVTKDFLSTAISQTLAGKPVTPSVVHAMGCSIKWKR